MKASVGKAGMGFVARIEVSQERCAVFRGADDVELDFSEGLRHGPPSLFGPLRACAQWLCLLGETRLHDLMDSEFHRDCYFFYNSAFYRWRTELDGAVVADIESAQLCVNPYSPRVEALRKSHLARALGAGVLDPEGLEKEGRVLLADCTADRSDSSAVLAYLQEKTGRPTLMNLDMGYQAVWAAVDLPDDC